MQTLKELQIGSNEFGDDGVKYVADILRKNTVNYSFSFFYSRSFLFRHSLNSRLDIMKLRQLELNIWRMLYKQTQ